MTFTLPARPARRSLLDRGRVLLTVALTGLAGNMILTVMTVTNPRAHG